MIVRKINHTHIHTLTSSQLHALASGPEAARLSSDAKVRLGWIVAFVESGHSVSKTCETLGISKSTFHRWLDRFDPSDLSTLEEKSHEPLTPRQSGVSADAITLIRAYRQTNPNMGKEKIHALLAQEHGIHISSSTIGRVIERECLYFAATPLHWKKRTTKTDVGMQEPATETEAATTVSTHMISTPAFEKRHPAWKRALITSSILINIAIIALFMMTAGWELKDMKAQLSTQQNDNINTVSNLDRP